MQGIQVPHAAIVDLVRRLAVGIDNRGVTEAVVGAVVDGEDVAGLCHHHVECIAQTCRINAQGSIRREDRLVETIVPAERATDVKACGGLITWEPVIRDGGIVQGRQIVFVDAGDARDVGEGLVWDGVERNQIDLEHRGGEGIFGGVREIVGWGAVVGVAALGDIEFGAIGAQRHAVGRMVLLRAWQAADKVHLRPVGSVPGQLGQDAGVRVQVGIRAGGDARIARRHVENRVRRGSGHQDAGHLTVGDRRVERAVVVVVRDALDEVDGLARGRGPSAISQLRNIEDLDDAVLLTNIEAAVWTELQRGRVGYSADHLLTGECGNHLLAFHRTLYLRQITGNWGINVKDLLQFVMLGDLQLERGALLLKSFEFGPLTFFEDNLADPKVDVHPGQDEPTQSSIGT
jgi:hypothetical protein